MSPVIKKLKIKLDEFIVYFSHVLQELSFPLLSQLEVQERHKWWVPSSPVLGMYQVHEVQNRVHSHV